ncbi:copper resistance CopC family protein [Cellulomonas sp.]|uniref:copper resistance CopC family protein n=1 Tax=Cellulomonas sp. TaxID=40001 RepID=UPI003BAC9460
MPSRHPARLVPAALVGLVLALGTLVIGAPAAQAHNALQGTDPAEGSTVPVMPETVTLTFNEPALFVGTEIMVHTADETMVNIGPPVLVDNTVSQAVTGELPAGEYTVIYRVTSADGHPIEGQFRFTAAEATSYGVATAAPTMTASPSPTTSAEVLADESAAPTASPTASAPPVPESRVSGGVLVGVVGALAVAGGVAALLLLLRRRPPGSSGSPSGSLSE